MDLSFINLPFTADLKLNLSDQFLTELINQNKHALIEDMSIACKNSYFSLSINTKIGFIRKKFEIDLIIHKIDISKDYLQVTFHYKNSLVMGINALTNLIGLSKLGNIIIKNHEIVVDFSDKWLELISQYPNLLIENLLKKTIIQHNIKENDLEISLIIGRH